MQLLLNGKPIGETEVRSSNTQEFTFSVPAGALLAGADNQLVLVFTNDTYTPGNGSKTGADRNLYVESVRVGSYLMQPGDAGVSLDRFSTGEHFAGQSKVAWNGALHFTVPAAATASINRQVVGTVGNDLLSGGAGNDLLVGKEGADVYLFGRGSGADVIDNSDSDKFGSQPDTLVFAPDLLPADLQLARSGDSLLLTIKGTQERIELLDYFKEGGNSALESIRFADGTNWTPEVIRKQLTIASSGNDSLYGASSQDWLSGGAGDDALYGLAGDDVLDGGAGDDYLVGGAGNDTYLFGKGDGIDVIYDMDESERNLASFDRLRFKPGLTAKDLDIYTSDNTMVFRIRATGERVYVSNWCTGAGYALQGVEFADGSSISATALRSVPDFPTGFTYSQQLNGSDADDALYGDGGNDTLFGGAGNDRLEGGRGNDLLVGGTGTDTYVYGQGDGVDRIDNYEYGMSSVIAAHDRLLFKAGISDRDLGIQRSGSDLILQLKNSNDQICLSNWFGGEAFKLQTIEFADGTKLNTAQIEQWLDSVPILGTEVNDQLFGGGLTDRFYGLAGDDLLIGNAGNDWLEGGRGKDFLAGGTGSDTYLFGLGDGSDVIKTSDLSLGMVEGHQDRLLFKSGITMSDLHFQRSGMDLMVTLYNPGDQITISSWFGGEDCKLQSIEFADGSRMSTQQIEAMALAMPISGSSGDDYVYGTSGADYLSGLAGDDKLLGGDGDDWLDGGLGNDALRGEGGSDTYLFGRGDGQDNIEEDYGQVSGRLLFKEGISRDDITYRREWDQLIFAIKDSKDQIAISHWFGNSPSKLQSVAFADGSTLDLQQMEKQLTTIQGTAGNDILYGYESDDTLYGLDGSDNLYGNSGNDRLDGGAGMDYLDGGSGDDTYLFGLGDGWDTISNNNAYGDMDNDRLLFKAGIKASDIDFQCSGLDLIASIKGSGEDVTIKAWFLQDGFKLQTFEFADGTKISRSEVDQRFMQGDAGNNTLKGSAQDEILLGLDGDDRLDGGYGNDTLQGGNGKDLLLGSGGNDKLLGEDGDDQLNGDARLATIVVKASADLLNDVGAMMQLRLDGKIVGQSEVRATTLTDYAFDVVLPAGSKGALDVVFTNDAVINGKDRNLYVDSIKVEDYLCKSTDSSVKLDKGNGAAAFDGLNVINGQKGVYWNGALRFTLPQSLFPTAGNDTLDGGLGNDILDGAGGNDYLYGGSGNDTYLFGRGYGSDTILDWYGSDTLQLNEGISADQLWFSKSGYGLKVAVIGTTDSVTVTSWFSDTSEQVEQIKTADGKTLLASQVQNLVAAMSSLTPPAAGQTTLSADYHSKLDAVIAANWK